MFAGAGDGSVPLPWLSTVAPVLNTTAHAEIGLPVDGIATITGNGDIAEVWGDARSRTFERHAEIELPLPLPPPVPLKRDIPAARLDDCAVLQIDADVRTAAAVPCPRRLIAPAPARSCALLMLMPWMFEAVPNAAVASGSAPPPKRDVRAIAGDHRDPTERDRAHPARRRGRSSG